MQPTQPHCHQQHKLGCAPEVALHHLRLQSEQSAPDQYMYLKFAVLYDHFTDNTTKADYACMYACTSTSSHHT